MGEAAGLAGLPGVAAGNRRQGKDVEALGAAQAGQQEGDLLRQALIERQDERYEEAKENRLRREAEKSGFRLVPTNADEATATS